MVENAQDVIEELAAYLDMGTPDFHEDRVRNHTAKRQVSLPPEELDVYNNLSPYPEHIDTIIRKTHIASGKLLSLLLQLELKGFVQQLPGKYFALFGTTSEQKENP